MVLPGEEVGRREERALQPGPRRRRERLRRHGGLARTRRRPGGAGASASAGRGRPGSSPIAASWSAVSATSWPELSPERAVERGAERARRRRRRRRPAGPRRARAAAAARPCPSWSASSSSNASRRSAASRPSNDDGVVGLLERLRRSPTTLLALADRGRQVLRVRPCRRGRATSRIAIRSRSAVRPAVSR